MVKLNEPLPLACAVPTVYHRPGRSTCSDTLRPLPVGNPLPLPVGERPFLIRDDLRGNERPWVASTAYPIAGSVPSTMPLPRESSAALKLVLLIAFPRSTGPLQLAPLDVDSSIR